MPLRRVRERLFGIDLRALAALRICLAFLLLCDLAARLSDLAAFYTDDGVLPSTLVRWRLDPLAFSVHLLSGDAAIQAALFLVHGLCAAAMLVGWRTRWTTALSWFLLTSLHYRNPSILFGADKYLRVLLFWSLFLPLGARWSLDSVRGPARGSRPVRLCTWGTAAMLIQNAIVYLTTGALKWKEAAWQEGTALYYSLSVDQVVKEFANVLLRFPDVLNAATYAALYLELVGPLLLFSPFWTAPLRTAVVVCLMLMHFGIFLSLKLWIFPWVNMAALLIFLPSAFWDRVAAWGQYLGQVPFGVAWRRRCRDRWTRLVASMPQRPVVIGEPKPIALCMAVLLVAVVFWNLTVVAPSLFRMPRRLRPLYFLPHLDQDWRMFVKPETFGSGWMVVAGTLGDGTQVNLLDHGAALTWEAPRRAKNFTSIRWRRYLSYMNRGDDGIVRGDDSLRHRNYAGGRVDGDVRREFARYLCHSWSASHGDGPQLKSVEVAAMSRNVTPGSQEQGPYRKVVSFRDECRRYPRLSAP